VVVLGYEWARGTFITLPTPIQLIYVAIDGRHSVHSLIAAGSNIPVGQKAASSFWPEGWLVWAIIILENTQNNTLKYS
jgi:hypothetical protein